MGIISRAFEVGSLLVAASANAQQKASAQPENKTDYSLVGAPIPRLKVLLYHDTTKRPAETLTPAERKAWKHQKKKATTMGSQLYLTDKDVDNGANLFVMLFSPTCGHCQDMAVNIEANIASFKKSQLVLVANPMMRPYLYDFSELTRAYKYPSINIGIDSSGFVDKTFRYQMLPQINIYDKDRKLLKIYTGDTPFDSLRKYIQ